MPGFSKINLILYKPESNSGIPVKPGTDQQQHFGMIGRERSSGDIPDTLLRMIETSSPDNSEIIGTIIVNIIGHLPDISNHILNPERACARRECINRRRMVQVIVASR